MWTVLCLATIHHQIAVTSSSHKQFKPMLLTGNCCVMTKWVTNTSMSPVQILSLPKFVRALSIHTAIHASYAAVCLDKYVVLPVAFRGVEFATCTDGSCVVMTGCSWDADGRRYVASSLCWDTWSNSTCDGNTAHSFKTSCKCNTYTMSTCKTLYGPALTELTTNETKYSQSF